MYEEALRKRYRFNYKGLLSVEDLWDLTVEELDGLYKGLHDELRSEQKDSLLNKKSHKADVLTKKIAIVKHIFEVKLNEALAREQAALRAEQKQKILSIIAQKQDAELSEKSIDELTAMVNGL